MNKKNSTDTKTGSSIFFLCVWQKPRKLNTQKLVKY